MLTLHYSISVDASIKKSLFTGVLRRAQKQLAALTHEPPHDPRAKIPETELELALVDDATIQRFNRETRGLDKPTDVLSFANREITDPALRAASAHSLGQIVISLPAAERNAREIGQAQANQGEDRVSVTRPGAEWVSRGQARAGAEWVSRGQSLEEELKFLFLHGLLHILGYDHKTSNEEFEMMSLAYAILGRPPYQK